MRFVGDYFREGLFLSFFLYFFIYFLFLYLFFIYLFLGGWGCAYYRNFTASDRGKLIVSNSTSFFTYVTLVVLLLLFLLFFFFFSFFFFFLQSGVGPRILGISLADALGVYGFAGLIKGNDHERF